MLWILLCILVFLGLFIHQYFCAETNFRLIRQIKKSCAYPVCKLHLKKEDLEKEVCVCGCTCGGCRVKHE